MSNLGINSATTAGLINSIVGGADGPAVTSAPLPTPPNSLVAAVAQGKDIETPDEGSKTNSTAVAANGGTAPSNVMVDIANAAGSALKDFQAATGVTATTLKNFTDAGVAIGKSISDKLLGVGQAQATIQAATSANTQKTQADINAIAARNQIQEGGANGLTVALSADNATQGKEYKQLQDEIVARQHVNFFDNPIEYLYNQAYKIPNLQRVADADYTSIMGQQNILQKVAESTSALGTQAALEDQQETAAAAAAKQREVLLKAGADADQAMQESLKLGMQGVSAQQAINMDQFSAATEYSRTLADAANLRIQAWRASIDSQFQGQFYQDRSAQIQQALKDTQQGDAMVKGVAQSLGLPQNVINGLTMSNLPKILSGNPALKRIWDTALSTPDSAFGGSYGQIKQDLNSAVGMVNLPTNAKILMQNVESKLASLRPTRYTTATPQQKAQFDDDAINTIEQREGSNIPDTGSIYSLAPLASQVTKTYVKNNPVMQSLVPLAQANNQLPTSAQQVLDSATRLVAQGKLDAKKAAAYVSSFYQGATSDRNAANPYGRLGIITPEGYHTSVTIRGPSSGRVHFGDTAKIVDMSNPSEVYNALMQSNLAYRAAQAASGN